MNNRKEGRKYFAGLLVALIIPSLSLAAEEMDHSQHQHHKHTEAAQASQHVHHSHGAEQWMFEYRFMRMEMEDLLRGEDSVSTEDVSGVTAMGTPCMMAKDPTRPYCMAPTEMTMDMHMLMAMYGFSDKLAGMLMFNYLDNQMDMVMHMRMMAGGPVMMSMESDMETSGTGDTLVGFMYKLDDELTTALSLSIPTGEIDEEIEMMNTTMKAPYGMQLGTGTYDLLPSISYLSTSGKWTVGGQAEYRYHIGENDNDYAWGNKLELNGWGKYAVSSYFNIGGRVTYVNRKTIDGQDPDIMPIMSPLTDPANYGGKRMDLGLDLTARVGGHLFGVSYAVPVMQDVDGIQMEVQSILTFSYQYTN